MVTKLGLCVVGLSGNVGSTVACAIELMKKNLVENRCLISDGFIDISKGTIEMIGRIRNRKMISDELNLREISDIVVCGWDVKQENIYENSISNNIIEIDKISQIQDEILKINPWEGYDCNNSDVNKSEMLNSIEQDIHKFKERNDLDNIIIINLLPTEKYIKLKSIHKSLDEFECGIENNDPLISNSMIYAYASMKSKCPFIEFTPNYSIDVPAISQMGLKNNLPMCGKDGKTGQTFLKSVIAQALRSRQLRIEGWYSTNILGNTDGMNLSSEQNRKSKINSKIQLLNGIVGYEVSNHVVDISYYPPKRDNKEAWDSIDILGFLGNRLELKINFQCKDSILATPMILDLVRFVDYCSQKRLSGYQSWLSIYFKQQLFTEMSNQINGFFEQEKMFVDFLLNEIEN